MVAAAGLAFKVEVVADSMRVLMGLDLHLEDRVGSVDLLGDLQEALVDPVVDQADREEDHMGHLAADSVEEAVGIVET